MESERAMVDDVGVAMLGRAGRLAAARPSPAHPLTPPRVGLVGDLCLWLINLADGCMVPDPGTEDGWSAPARYDFAPLRAATQAAAGKPDLVGVCEAKRWRDNNFTGLCGACTVLEDVFGVPFDGRVGVLGRGDYPPALLFDPAVVTVSRWGGPTAPLHEQNVAELTTADGEELIALVDHLDLDDGDVRVTELRRKLRTAAAGRRAVAMLDANGTASGRHLPQRDVDQVDPATRHRKHWQPLGPGTAWVDDHRALDELFGVCVDDDGRTVRRTGGAGFHPVCEIAAAGGLDRAVAFQPGQGWAASRSTCAARPVNNLSYTRRRPAS